MSIHELAAHGILGEEARKFVDSELGKCVLAIAEQDAKLALLDLEDVDPTDVAKVRERQNKAKLAKMFGQYLGELITRGEEALMQWRQEQQK